MTRESELAGTVTASRWFTGMLTAVRAADLPDAWVGAGVLRDLVWGGTGFDPAAVRDVDVAFFDPDDLGRDRSATAALHAHRPDIPWEATNQAAVHTWYAEFYAGPEVAPLQSTADGVATWPETATSVAVRLGADDRLKSAHRTASTTCSTASGAATRAGSASSSPAYVWPATTRSGGGRRCG